MATKTKVAKKKIKSGDNHTLDQEAQDIILKSTAKVSTLAALPLPFIDVAGTAFLTMRMVDKLAEHYKIDVENKQKVFISTFIGTLLSKLISEGISRLPVSSKIEKIFGESLIKASMSGFMTTVTGEIYLQHFQKGGTLEDFTLDNYIHYFKELVKSDRLSVRNIGGYFVESAYNKLNPMK